MSRKPVGFRFVSFVSKKRFPNALFHNAPPVTFWESYSLVDDEFSGLVDELGISPIARVPLYPL